MPQTKAFLVFFNGRSNAGGAERMVGYLEDYLVSRGITTQIVDEDLLRHTWLGRLYWKLFGVRHFEKRRLIYMARFASAYAWWRRRPGQFWVSNGEATPFFPVDLVISQGCYHIMERAYGRKEEELSRIAKLQMRGIRIARQVIAVTDQVKRNLVKYYGISPEKIAIVANRVDTDFFKPGIKSQKNNKTLLYAGRLENGKGLPLLLSLAEAIEKQQEWRLLIACNNQQHAEMFRQFSRTDIIIGLGLHNMNEKAYQQCDVVIFPSLFESFGMITIEALSAGVPVLATPVGIIPQMAEQNFPGVYVLHESNGDELILRCNEIVLDFADVDRTALHQQIKDDYGIESYRIRLDEVLATRLNLQQHG